MLSFTKTSGLFSQSLSPRTRTRRQKPRASLGLESLEERQLMSTLISARWFAAVVFLSAVSVAAPPAMAGGGNVLPATAKPRGYSLADLARATAAFNVSDRNPANVPDIPFQVLFTPTDGNSNTFFVRPGTMFYVPLLYIDDSPPIVGDFPDDLNNRAELEAYVFGPDQIGVDLLQIIVDGKVTDLGPEYVVGVTTPPLPDGGGTHYIVPAAVLGPLSPGVHTVVIRNHVSGLAVGGPPGFGFEGTYTIHVK